MGVGLQIFLLILVSSCIYGVYAVVIPFTWTYQSTNGLIHAVAFGTSLTLMVCVRVRTFILQQEKEYIVPYCHIIRQGLAVKANVSLSRTVHTHTHTHTHTQVTSYLKAWLTDPGKVKEAGGELLVHGALNY